MDFRVLNYFLTVAREKTISQAAEVLHVSQPTLSKQLKDLEEELGVTLFIRGNRAITLTEDGLYLVNRGKEILSLVDTTKENLRSNEAISGRIAIGGGETQAFHYVGSCLKNLQQRHPDIKVDLYSGNADTIFEKLTHGLLDFGLVIDPVEKQKYNSLRLPFINHWGILVHRTNPLAAKAEVSPTDIQSTPLMISNQSLVDNQLSDWLGGSLDDFNIIGTYNLLYNASLLAAENIAGVLCIDGIINTAQTDIIFIPFSPALTAKTSIVWKKNPVFSRPAKAFLQLLKASINQTE